MPRPFSVHAEQSALATGWLRGEGGLTALAVTAPPRGHCRQFRYKLLTGGALAFVFDEDADGVRLDVLLPRACGPGNLGVKGGLMAVATPVPLDSPAHDPLVSAALIAASELCAPCTGG